MFLKIGMLTLFLLLSYASPVCAQSAADKTAAIDHEVEDINSNLSNLKKTEALWDTDEGISVESFSDATGIRKLHSEAPFATGKSLGDYYFLNNTLIYGHRQISHCETASHEGQACSSDNDEDTQLYFSGSVLVQLLESNQEVSLTSQSSKDKKKEMLSDVKEFLLLAKTGDGLECSLTCDQTKDIGSSMTQCTHFVCSE